MDLISIIVPIYHVEKYLRSCIESILNQTYTNLEIILVDDGSPDSCGEICDEYARKDERIAVIHQPNSGVARARNVAIERFRGDYVVFIDSDDTIEPQMIELLYKILQENEATFSMVLGRMVGESYNSEYKNLNLSSIKTRMLSQDELMRGLFSLSDIDHWEFQVIWNKLFPKDLIKNTYFIKTGTEDTEFNSRVFLKTENVVCGLVPMYNWVQHTDSITHEPINPRKIDIINSYYLIFKSFEGNKQFQAYCLDYLYKTMLSIRHHAKGTSYESEARKKCKHYKKLTMKTLMSNNTLSIHRRLGMKFLYHCPFVYDAFMWLCETRAKLR